MKFSESQKDQYRKQAKIQGYRSRSAFKLLQINNSFKIIRPGFKVIDVGCAPGGWLQVAFEETNSRGKIIGIDLKPVDPLEGIKIIEGDIQDENIIHSIIEYLQSKADVILSDLSPNISGLWDLDHSKQIHLTRICLSVSRKVLKTNGNAIFKVFYGDQLESLKLEMKESFRNVTLHKPKASRDSSSEIYIVAKNFCANN
jgi:23S rRNA (uridine2552-2'-O)-methyltransferase